MTRRTHNRTIRANTRRRTQISFPPTGETMKTVKEYSIKCHVDEAMAMKPDQPSIDDCLYHRCLPHRMIPAYNANDGNGGECPACFAVEIKQLLDAAMDNLLLDIYPLTIANAAMDAGEQRLFADDVAAHIANARRRITEILNLPVVAADGGESDGT